jgi:hypothetical protein
MMLFAGVLLTGCPQPNGYTVVRAFPHLSYGRMVALEPIPGDPDHALLVTQGGMIRRVSLADQAEPSTVFLDLSARLIDNAHDEEGLLGLAFAPDYARRGRFFVHYTTNPRHNRVSRFTTRGAAADPESERVIIELPSKGYENHNGGALAFGPDGNLYIGVGDAGGARPDRQRAEHEHALRQGARINVSGDAYTVPAIIRWKAAACQIHARGPPTRGAPASTRDGPALGRETPARTSGRSRPYREGRQPAEHAGGQPLLRIREWLRRQRQVSPRGVTADLAASSSAVTCGARDAELDGWYVGDFCSATRAVDIASDGGAAILPRTAARRSSFAQDGPVSCTCSRRQRGTSS